MRRKGVLEHVFTLFFWKKVKYGAYRTRHELYPFFLWLHVVEHFIRNTTILVGTSESFRVSESNREYQSFEKQNVTRVKD